MMRGVRERPGLRPASAPAGSGWGARSSATEANAWPTSHSRAPLYGRRRTGIGVEIHNVGGELFAPCQV